MYDLRCTMYDFRGAISDFRLKGKRQGTQMGLMIMISHDHENHDHLCSPFAFLAHSPCLRTRTI
jgi:hypothetical protein